MSEDLKAQMLWAVTALMVVLAVLSTIIKCSSAVKALDSIEQYNITWVGTPDDRDQHHVEGLTVDGVFYVRAERK
jgi:hypothetical protein